MARESLFNAVKQLQEERQARHTDMMNFMKGLSGTGQVGYGIGYGLSRLFGGDGTDTAMQQAEREDAYAQQYMMASPERRAELRSGGYALSPEFGRKLDAIDAAQAKAQLEADLTRAQIANYQSQIEERGKPDTTKPTEIKPLTKQGQKQYESILEATPSLKAEFEALLPSTYEDIAPTWLGGEKVTSGDIKTMILNRANEFRQSPEYKGLGLTETLRLALNEFKGASMQPTAPQPTAPAATAPQAPTLPSLQGVTGTK